MRKSTWRTKNWTEKEEREDYRKKSKLFLQKMASGFLRERDEKRLGFYRKKNRETEN